MMRAEFPLFLLSTLFQALQSSPQSLGRCENYSSSGFQERSSNLACDGAIDYSYYVPSGYSSSDLNVLAISRLSDSTLSILSELCGIAYKKAICSTIYLPCLIGSSTKTLSDNITGLVSITPYTVQFQRPCASLCFDAHEKCGLLLSLTDHKLLCDAQHDYSYGSFPKGNSSWSLPYLFDQTNTRPTCNSMTASFSVGSRIESYQYQSNGFCRGHVTEVFIPALWESFWPPTGTFRGPYFSPMQPPYVIQEMIEAELQRYIQQRLPVSLSEKCHFALKNYFCKRYFARPQELKMRSRAITESKVFRENSLLLGGSISLSVYKPYPVTNEVFTDFELNCGDFSQYLNLTIMAPQHDDTAWGGEVNTLQFESDAIKALLDEGEISIDAAGSASQTVSQASSAQKWITSCPSGFVVPDHPNDPGVIWALDSGCASACRLPGMFTERERKVQQTIVLAAPALGLPLISLVILTWMTNKGRLRKQYLIFAFICLSALLTVVFLTMAITESFGSKVCRDNATRVDQSDGISVCVVQAAVMIYCCLGISFCWCIQSIELFFKIVLKKKLRRRVLVHIIIIFFIPLGIVIYAALGNNFGYNGELPFCLMIHAAPTAENILANDVRFFYLPIISTSFLGTCSMVAVIIKILLSSKKANIMARAVGRVSPDLAGGVILPTNTEFRGAEAVPVTSLLGAHSSIPRSSGFLHSTFHMVDFGSRKTNVKKGLSCDLRLLVFPAAFKGMGRKYRLLRTSLYFLSFYLVLWMTIVGYRAFQFIYRVKLQDSLREWTICVFDNFQGDDNAWITVCGGKPNRRISTAAASWFLIVISGHSILITAIFLPAVRQSLTLWGKNLFLKFRILVRRSTGKKLSWYWGSYYSTRREQFRAKMASWRSRRVMPDYPTGATRTLKLDKRSESENVKSKENGAGSSNSNKNIKNIKNSNNNNNNNGNNNIKNNNNNNDSNSNINRSNSSIQSERNCLEPVPTEEMLKILQMDENKILSEIYKGDKNNNTLIKVENLTISSNKLKENEKEKEKENEKAKNASNDSLLGKLGNSFHNSDSRGGFSLRRLSLSIGSSNRSISRNRSTSSHTSSHTINNNNNNYNNNNHNGNGNSNNNNNSNSNVYNKNDLLPHSGDDEKYHDNNGINRDIDNDKRDDNDNDYDYYNDHIETNDNSDNFDCDSNSGKTETDHRIFTIVNSDFIRRKLNEEENGNLIHENSLITVVSPVKIIPSITESLPIQIPVKTESISRPENTEININKVPAPPPITGSEKSPKKILALKNTIKSNKEKTTEKNGSNNETSKGVVKSVRFKKTNEVKIVDARDQAESFYDVETSASVLNDIKPSKFRRFRLPEWT